METNLVKWYHINSVLYKKMHLNMSLQNYVHFVIFFLMYWYEIDGKVNVSLLQGTQIYKTH